MTNNRTLKSYLPSSPKSARNINSFVSRLCAVSVAEIGFLQPMQPVQMPARIASYARDLGVMSILIDPILINQALQVIWVGRGK